MTNIIVIFILLNVVILDFFISEKFKEYDHFIINGPKPKIETLGMANNPTITKEVLGEYYDILEYPYWNGVETVISHWEKFYNTEDSIGSNTKINGNWYKNEDIIWYKDQYEDQKRIIEKRLNKKAEGK